MEAQAFVEQEAERLFVLIAARQLIRALDAFDGNHRLPASVTSADVELLRNAAEHWDDETGKWGKEARQRGVEPSHYIGPPMDEADWAECSTTTTYVSGRTTSPRPSGRCRLMIPGPAA